MNKMIERDCGFFTGGTLLGIGGSGGKIDESKNIENYEDYYVIEFLTGDASSIDTGKLVDGGTALTTDLLKFSGGDSSK